MRRLLQVICDYQGSSQEFGEILQRLYAQNQDLDLAIIPTSVPSFDTLATGFLLSQYALGEHPEGMVLYVNTAPRKEKKQAMENNAGEKLVYARLLNGVEIVAVNSGYSLSLVKDQIKELRLLAVEDRGSQFRSRDFFPPVVSDILHGRYESRWQEEVDPAQLRSVPLNAVLWVDGFGNIKTTTRRSQHDFSPGRKVLATINGVQRAALVTGGSFSVAEGELAFSAGSSGYDDPFMELFLRGGSAHELFKRPLAGSTITFAGEDEV